jgi:hypothetical protein
MAIAGIDLQAAIRQLQAEGAVFDGQPQGHGAEPRQAEIRIGVGQAGVVKPKVLAAIVDLFTNP